VSALEQVEVSSAGLCAQPGARAAHFAQVVAREWGTSLDEHRARLFMPEHTGADLIVTMTRDQCELLQTHFDLEPSRVRVLGTYLPHAERTACSSRLAPLWGHDYAPAPLCSDILDPFGGSLEGYQECARHIRRAVSLLVRAVAVQS
jgi:protein-tyrosine-phosphatase